MRRFSRSLDEILPALVMFVFGILAEALFAAPPQNAAVEKAVEQVDVFVSGRDGYHTYRIPATAVTEKGTILAFCEGRKTSRHDHGDVDLILRRSADGGRTWSPTQLVHEEGAFMAIRGADRRLDRTSSTATITAEHGTSVVKRSRACTNARPFSERTARSC